MDEVVVKRGGWVGGLLLSLTFRSVNISEKHRQAFATGLHRD